MSALSNIKNFANPAKRAIKSIIFNILKFIICRNEKSSFENLEYHSNSFKILAYFASDDLQKDVVWFKAAENGDVEKISQIYESFKDNININAGWKKWKNSPTALHVAISKDHQKVVKKLLDFGADGNAKETLAPLDKVPKSSSYEHQEKKATDLNIRDEQGNTPLHSAISAGNLELVKYFLTIASPEILISKNSPGQTPLHIAILRQDLSNIRNLINLAPESLKIEDNQGIAPLDMPEAYKDIKILNFLLTINTGKPDDEIFKKKFKEQAFVEAVKQRNVDLVKKIIEEFGETLISFITSYRALHLAAFYSNLEILNILLSIETNPPLKEEIKQKLKDMIFIRAVENGEISEVKKIVQQFGKKVMDARNSGDTALHIAARLSLSSKKHNDIIAFLVEEKAPQDCLNSRNQTYKDIILTNLILESKNENQLRELINEYAPQAVLPDNRLLREVILEKELSFTKFLINLPANESKININAPFGGDRTLLHLAARNGFLDEIAFLIEKNANTEITNSKGENFRDLLLRWAAIKGNLDEVIEVLKYQVDLNHEYEDGNTILHLAAHNRGVEAVEIINFLVKKGANPTIKNKNNLTCVDLLLYSAIKNKDLNLVKQLIAEGANITVEYQDGETALTLASKIGDQDIINFFKEKGFAPKTATVTNASSLTSQAISIDTNKQNQLNK